jgi:FdhE protein
MQRILDPAQIEAFAQRSVARLRFADPAQVFLQRAQRLRHLSGTSPVGDYLGLMAALCEAQQRALSGWNALAHDPACNPAEAQARIARAAAHDLPLLPAPEWPRDARWRVVLSQLCRESPQDAPPTVRDLCERLARAEAADLEAAADRLLGGAAQDLDLQTAPFLMAALQVYWVQMATTLSPEARRTLEGAHNRTANTAMAGVCPVCGTPPVASVVRAEAQYQGYRYLHCGLCATEWHFVRIKCTHCLVTQGIRYHYREGASDALRAESCESCHSYRKIVYQEKDAAVEPLADDLSSLDVDLLMSAENYHRASGNPLLWQAAGA